MIIRVIEKEKWTNKKRPCQKKHGRYTLAMRKIELLLVVMLNSPELLALGEATDLIPLAHIVGDKGLQQKNIQPYGFESHRNSLFTGG